MTDIPGIPSGMPPADITVSGVVFSRCESGDGVIVACEPDDTINPGIPREDEYLPEEVIDKGLIQTRPCAKGYAQAQMIIRSPHRVKYPMKRVGAEEEKGNLKEYPGMRRWTP